MRARHRHTHITGKDARGMGLVTNAFLSTSPVTFAVNRAALQPPVTANTVGNANVVPELRGNSWSCRGVAVVCLLPEDRPSSALAAASTALLVNAAFVGGGEGRPSVFSGLGVLRYNHMTAGDNQPKRSLCRQSVEKWAVEFT